MQVIAVECSFFVLQKDEEKKVDGHTQKRKFQNVAKLPHHLDHALEVLLHIQTVTNRAGGKQC